MQGNHGNVFGEYTRFYARSEDPMPSGAGSCPPLLSSRGSVIELPLNSHPAQNHHATRPRHDPFQVSNESKSAGGFHRN